MSRHPMRFLLGEKLLGGPPAVPGNAVTLLVDGAEAFPAMLSAISRARRSIVMESYIFADDATGARFRDALAARARAGVSVRLMVDGVGSLGTAATFFAPLVQAGGRLATYRPPRFWAPQWGLWFRNHRKILVVDDQHGFIGGLNIGDAYAPTAWGGEAWHDVHAQVDGPAARELTRLFNRVWRRETRDKSDWNARLGPSSREGRIGVQILESRLTQRHSIRRAYLHAIRQARHTVRICNAYFVPDQGVLRALRNAERRGVKVQLLLAGKTDVKVVQYASRALYAKLLRWGVEIHEWTDRVLHAKSAVIDGAWCSIGSYNMDRRSLLHNLEANIACVDKGLGRAMDAQFSRDLKRSVRIDPDSWHRRPPLQKLLEQLFYKLRYLL